MATTRTRSSVKKVPKFTISLDLGVEHYEGAGETPLAALHSMGKPRKIFLKGVVRISNGTKTRELAYSPLQVKRLFYPVAQKLVAKELGFGMI